VEAKKRKNRRLRPKIKGKQRSDDKKGKRWQGEREKQSRVKAF